MICEADNVVILKCKEKDLVYNMRILCKNSIEIPFGVPCIISGGRWFYFPIKHKSEVEKLKLKGKILE